MTALEHLIENALGAIERDKDFNYFKDDVNFELRPDILPEDIWEIANYVYYTYLRAVLEGIAGSLGYGIVCLLYISPLLYISNGGKR